MIDPLMIKALVITICLLAAACGMLLFFWGCYKFGTYVYDTASERFTLWKMKREGKLAYLTFKQYLVFNMADPDNYPLNPSTVTSSALYGKRRVYLNAWEFHKLKKHYADEKKRKEIALTAEELSNTNALISQLIQKQFAENEKNLEKYTDNMKKTLEAMKDNLETEGV